MRRRLSQGIRIYEHDRSRDLVRRSNFNFLVGYDVLRAWLTVSSGMKLFAVGTEEGAMVAHFKWAN